MILAFLFQTYPLCIRGSSFIYLTTYLLPILLCGFSILISGAPKTRFCQLLMHVSSPGLSFHLLYGVFKDQNLILMWCNFYQSLVHIVILILLLKPLPILHHSLLFTLHIFSIPHKPGEQDLTLSNFKVESKS